MEALLPGPLTFGRFTVLPDSVSAGPLPQPILDTVPSVDQLAQGNLAGLTGSLDTYSLTASELAGAHP